MAWKRGCFDQALVVGEEFCVKVICQRDVYGVSSSHVVSISPGSVYERNDRSLMKMPRVETRDCRGCLSFTDRLDDHRLATENPQHLGVEVFGGPSPRFLRV